MENKVERKINDDGTYVEITTTSTTPEDGFVIDKQKSDFHNEHYIKGYQVYKTIETDDPRIVKPILIILCLIFYIIGIILIITKNYILGLMFFIITTFVLVSQLKQINAHEKELLQNPTYNPNNKEVLKDFGNTVKEEINDVAKTTFTKNNYKWLLKTSLPIYALICIILSIIIGIIISIIFSILYGILAFFGSFLLLTLIGIIYFLLISFLFK